MALATASCASSQWSLKTERSGIALQWPYQPNKAKVTYVMAIKGFTPRWGAASLLRAVVYGKDGSDEGAFSVPVAVATGRDGRIAVADIGCKCVHLYIPGAERYVRLSAAEKEAFISPVGVIFDDDLNLFISDSVAGKIYVFSGGGTYLFSFPGAGTQALERPTGLAYSSLEKRLYVADTLGNKIYAFDEKGNTLFSFGRRGEEKGGFNYPTHIFLAPSGVLHVTDTLNFRIELFDKSGGFLDSFGHHGDGSGDLAMPKGVAADKDGSIYVVDALFDNVQLFDRKGKFLLTIGKRGTDFGEFWLPSGIFIDKNDTLYVCDTYNRRVQVFRITENYVDGKF